jgi:hypothetical protein
MFRPNKTDFRAMKIIGGNCQDSAYIHRWAACMPALAMVGTNFPLELRLKIVSDSWSNYLRPARASILSRRSESVMDIETEKVRATLRRSSLVWNVGVSAIIFLGFMVIAVIGDSNTGKLSF